MLKVKYMFLNEQTHPVQYATTGSSGCDIYADLPTDIILEPGDYVTITTGIWPVATACEVRPKSSSIHRGYQVMFGTCDQDYEGEILVGIINFSSYDIIIKRGQKIAQLIKVLPAPKFTNIEICDKIRGTGGFGSTDKGYH